MFLIPISNISKLKMKRNNHFMDLLEVENKITKLEMIISYRRLLHNDKRAKLLKKINEIETQQISQFIFSREKECATLYELMENMNANIDDLKQDINKLGPQIGENVDIINKLNERLTDYVSDKSKYIIQENQKRFIS